MTSRGDRTRERLIEVAEQLFAERGVDGVSLREINVAAGQRNTAALHYHFSGRLGLLAAIAERHIPRLEARQQELFQTVCRDEADGDIRSVVGALVRPAAAYVEEGPSERCWTKISTQFVARPSMGPEALPSAGTPTGAILLRRLAELLSAEMRMTLANERVLTMHTASLHVLADRARLIDAPHGDRPILPAAQFADNLVGMMSGALTAPMFPDEL